MKILSVFSRLRFSIFLSNILVFGFAQVVAPAPAAAAPACVLNTDYTKDTSSVSGYTILKFTKAGTCSFRNTDAITTLDYLIVGGGGGGGAWVGGGGGGGGVVQGSSYSVAGLGGIPITVGSGGTGAWLTLSEWKSEGTSGGNSSLNGVVAYGGGKGGRWTTGPEYSANVVGSAGGSGNAGNWGGGTTGQGKAGGIGNGTQPHAAGGGGGASQIGGNGSQTDNGNGTGGKGGDGVSSSITGSTEYYGGGGGGGVHGNNNNSVYTGGAGGLGGGGAGSSHSGNYGTYPGPNYGFSGTANTGGGGGGSGGGFPYVENKAGNGGSGIVVIKYLTSSTRANEIDYAMNLTSSSYYADLTLTGSDSIQPSSSDAFSIEAWVRPTSTCTSRCTIYSREYQMRLTILNSKISFILYNSTGWGSWTELTTGDIPTNSWSHIAITRSGTAIKLFLNGFQIASYSQNYAPIASNTSYRTHVGIVQGGSDPFAGAIDEVKVWKSDRSNNISTDMHSSDETVSGLAAYWNFNEGTGRTAYNLVPGAISESDLTLSSDAFWNSTLISEGTTNGPYTVRTFYRTYLTGNDGWKVPAGVNAMTSIVVAGGGGGGAESDDTGWFGGGGGAGGYQTSNLSGLSQNLIQVQVGAGGRGGQQVDRSGSAISLPTNGQNSIFYNLSSTGGGAGGVSFTSGLINGASGGSGGGGATYGGSGGTGTAGQGNSGGSSPASGSCCAGGGGGGFGSAGGNGSAATVNGAIGGSAGNGVLNPFYISGKSPQYLAAGGAAGSPGSVGSAGSLGGTAAFTNATANTGSGGGGGGSHSSFLDKAGGSGGSGIIIIRWITASTPSYTKPVNANLNVGMTETFTVNVTTDSATSVLTRTFKWESSTAGVNGPWAVIKQGTGASNAFFSWLPPDTSTSGINFQYRLTVTDSDTAGLFISDSSTAYAVINGALGVSGSSSFGKSINSSRDETFTVTNGTPTYRYSLSPTISGITLDTRTVGYPVLRVAETATVGTYLETLTVTDSVSATFNYPLRITISAPPSLTAGGEIVKEGQVLNLDASNRWSIQAIDGAATAGLVWKDMSGGQKNASTSNSVAVNGATCTAPTFSSDYGGYFTFNGTTNCYYTPYLGSQFTAANTLEAWIKPSSNTHPNSTAILGQMYNTGGEQISLVMGDMDLNNGKIYVGFWSGNGWRYVSNAITPVANTWMHIVGTYDGTTLKTYLNGTLQGSATYSYYGTTNTKGYFIGKRWDTNSYFYPGAIAEVRAYNAALSQSQVTQNYNATRVRFAAENLNQTKLSQKHNTTTVETFTVTSGGDTKTVTFAVGNRTGIEWTTPDTATVKLTVKPDLVVGTFYDTITVTDNFSASTILPVRITISKGDQAKLAIGQYNAYPSRSTYPLNVTGGSGTGALTRTLTDSGTAQCVLTGGMMLTAAKVGKCSVRVVKDTDANFLAETGTATIFWIEWNDAYATRVASTPTEIVLNHKTEIIRHEYETLTVTSYTDTETVANTITSARPGQTIRILGLGFVSTDTTSQATFADNEYADRTGLTNDYIQVVVPTGAVTGPVIVDTLKGQAIGPTLTILSP